METIERTKDEMVTIEMNGKTFQVNKMIYHFIELFKIYGEEPDITTVINEFSEFIDYWRDFRNSKKDNKYDNTHLQRFNLFHTIKPKTQYADQQDYKDGKPMLYPVYRIENQTVHSMACGGNYPLSECILYAGDGKTIVKIK